MKNRLMLLLFWILCLLGGIFCICKMLCAIFTNPSRAWVQVLSFDQLGNAATGGDPDEYISSRAYRKTCMPDPKRSWKWLRKVLDWIETDHCKQAYESEMQSAQRRLERDKT